MLETQLMKGRSYVISFAYVFHEARGWAKYPSKQTFQSRGVLLLYLLYPFYTSLIYLNLIHLCSTKNASSAVYDSLTFVIIIGPTDHHQT